MSDGKIGGSSQSRKVEDKYCGENVYEGTITDADVLRHEMALARKDERRHHLPGSSLTAPLSDYERVVMRQKQEAEAQAAAHQAAMWERDRPAREYREALDAVAAEEQAEALFQQDVERARVRARLAAVGKPPGSF